MHRLHRSRRIAFAALLGLIVATSAPTIRGTVGQAAPADVINRVKAQYAPDTRLTVFDVKAEAKGNALEVSGDVEQTAAKDAILKALLEAGYANVVEKIAVLPDPAFAAKPLGIVTVSVAVMKTKPSHASELGNQMVMGSLVRVLKRESGWYFVQSMSDRYLGWMEPDHVAFMTKERVDAYQQASHAIVTSWFTVVREQAVDNSPVVADLVMGNVLETTGKSGTWQAVTLPDGRAGFVDGAAVTDYATWKSSRALTGENIEKTARLFTGVPYLWGGTSPKGFDCSGFAKTVFRLNGVELQRDADQQSNAGEAVATDNDLAQLRKGDLLFFGPRPGVARITHVGIYLGDKRFIHCAGMVKLNSFDPASPIYSDTLLKRLVKVRRMG
ncbi:MAG TPA: NlpC/P60 family protein [Vicinamibacterales bacterium]|jgi:cell wall-associated NlpC family hydrolase